MYITRVLQVDRFAVALGSDRFAVALEFRPPCGRVFIKTPQYWSTRRIGRQSPSCTCVSEMNMPSLSLRAASLGQKIRGAAWAAPPFQSRFCIGANYQGTSLRNPFFFLLLDSFLESSLLWESPVFAASAAGAVPAAGVAPAAVASLFVSAAAGTASLFAVVSVALASAGGVLAA